MNVCFHKTDVTPTKPCRMGGYERAKESVGVLDPIEVNTMLLEVDHKLMLLSMIDSICINGSFSDDIKEAIHQELNLPKEQIIISCIHTHSAPCFFKLTFESVLAEEALTAQLKQQVIQDMIACYHDQYACTAIYEHSTIEGIYGNRNQKEAWSDKSFHLIKFYHKDILTGIFANISTHPTLLDGKNLKLSADLLGHIRMALQAQYHVPVLISNGACGDVSTRFYRKEAGDLDQCATSIVSQHDETKQSFPLLLDSCINTQVIQKLDIDFRIDPNHVAIRKQVEQSDIPPKQLFLHKCDLKEALGAFHLQLEAQIFDYGKLMFITLPGDILSAFSKQIKDAFPNKHVILICYTGNYCNYFVPESEYGKYFETFNSRLPKGKADSFIQEIINIAKSDVYID